MSNVRTKKIGCWRVTTHEKSRNTNAEKAAMAWVNDHATEFGQLQLDVFIDTLKGYLGGIYANGTKNTVRVEKRVGAKYVGGAVDHYHFEVIGPSGWCMIVSEPIGTDINRHKLVQKS